jgi:peptidoglycan hydrolase-like protein with peptidoglycan-binding domain
MKNIRNVCICLCAVLSFGSVLTTSVAIGVASTTSLGVPDNEMSRNHTEPKQSKRQYVFTPNGKLLTLGSNGAEVADLQKFLEDQGYLHMPTTTKKGRYGNLTRDAVKLFQLSHGVSATGNFGPKTRLAVVLSLKNYSSNNNSNDFSGIGSSTIQFSPSIASSSVHKQPPQSTSTTYFTGGAGVSASSEGGVEQVKIDACELLEEDEVCSFIGQGGVTVRGLCKEERENIACVSGK